MRSKRITLRVNLIFWILGFLIIVGLASCQSGGDFPTSVTEIPTVQSDVAELIQTSSGQTLPTVIPPTATPDPAAIKVAWQSSPHANSYVQDSSGQNNTCARCHAPINWMPAMDDLPESCFACKFELEVPPPTISEVDWTDIPCNICHKVDKKDNIQPEYAWLEIAPLEEYAEVASSSELCLKCHAPVDIPGHGTINLGGAHAGYECTQCHSAHDTLASCDPAGCHAEPTSPIAGHDADHEAVSCVACHDGSGMEVGPNEENGIWTTFTSGSTNVSADKFAFTSHNIVLEASCDRCHFVNNPWRLSDSVVEP